ncbi:MAG: hypothetical protein JWR60_2151, partial [Polaromonas sp.]|nr:hypothetical protein [Polaromonas sp.]
MSAVLPRGWRVAVTALLVFLGLAGLAPVRALAQALAKDAPASQRIVLLTTYVVSPA